MALIIGFSTNPCSAQGLFQFSKAISHQKGAPYNGVPDIAYII